MEKYLEIIEVHGREILDSRGNPTVAAVVTVQDKETGYIPFVSTVNNRNIKILATSVEALQGFFQG